jgi:hypothetical protein
MHQANRTSLDRARQAFRGPQVTGVVIVQREGFGHAGNMDHSIDAPQRVLQARAADEFSEDRLGLRRKARVVFPADVFLPDEAPHALRAAAQPFHEVAADKSAASGDQDHAAVRKRAIVSQTPRWLP